MESLNDFFITEDKRESLSETAEELDNIDCLFVVFRRNDGSIAWRGYGYQSELLALIRILQLDIEDRIKTSNDE